MNLFDDIRQQGPNELVEVLQRHANVRIERIVSHGQTSPEKGWYDQSEQEWVLVLTGEGELTFADGRVLRLKAGDYCHIPAHCQHRVSWTEPTSPTVWLAIFYS